MAEWNLYGSERREIFEESIKPESLFYTLQQYQKTFGKTFSIVELLELEIIRAMALIAQAINDAPEFLLDQVGKAFSSSKFHPISDSIEMVAEAIESLRK